VLCGVLPCCLVHGSALSVDSRLRSCVWCPACLLFFFSSACDSACDAFLEYPTLHRDTSSDAATSCLVILSSVSFRVLSQSFSCLLSPQLTEGGRAGLLIFFLSSRSRVEHVRESATSSPIVDPSRHDVSSASSIVSDLSPASFASSSASYLVSSSSASSSPSASSSSSSSAPAASRRSRRRGRFPAAPDFLYPYA